MDEDVSAVTLGVHLHGLVPGDYVELPAKEADGLVKARLATATKAADDDSDETDDHAPVAPVIEPEPAAPVVEPEPVAPPVDPEPTEPFGHIPEDVPSGPIFDAVTDTPPA